MLRIFLKFLEASFFLLLLWAISRCETWNLIRCTHLETKRLLHKASMRILCVILSSLVLHWCLHSHLKHGWKLRLLNLLKLGHRDSTIRHSTTHSICHLISAIYWRDGHRRNFIFLSRCVRSVHHLELLQLSQVLLTDEPTYLRVGCLA